MKPYTVALAEDGVKTCVGRDPEKLKLQYKISKPLESLSRCCRQIRIGTRACGDTVVEDDPGDSSLRQ
jgi:hypothetical protein